MDYSRKVYALLALTWAIVVNGKMCRFWQKKFGGNKNGKFEHRRVSCKTKKVQDISHISHISHIVRMY
jgi:hypothetical protein